MNPNEEYKRHENCADDLYLFLDDKGNAPNTQEEVVVWSDSLKEIAKQYNITALLSIIDEAANKLLESSDIANDYKTIKTELAKHIQEFMSKRKNAIFSRADRLGLSMDKPIKPYIESPFEIYFNPGNQENDIYINHILVELYPKNHVNNQWNPLLTEFIIKKRLTKEEVADVTGANGEDAVHSTVSKLRAILRYNNLVRNDDIKVDIAPFSWYSQSYKLKITERS